jgi:hypothetical protein
LAKEACAGSLTNEQVQPPMPTTLMRQRKTMRPSFDGVTSRSRLSSMTIRRLFEEHRTENVGAETDTGTGLVPQPVHLVELDAKLQMLLDDVIDGDRRLDQYPTRLRVFGNQRSSVALELFLLEVYQVVILSSASAKPWSARGLAWPLGR